jgi:hypothetical protein
MFNQQGNNFQGRFVKELNDADHAASPSYHQDHREMNILTLVVPA